MGGLLSFEIFRFSNAGLIFLLLWLYGISCMTFSIFVSVFFSKSRSAVVLGLMVFFVSYFVSFAVNDSSESRPNKTLASLLPNIAFSLAFGVLASFEQGQSGIQNDNLSTLNNNYTFGTGIGFLVLDILIMALLSIYFEQV